MRTRLNWTMAFAALVAILAVPAVAGAQQVSRGVGVATATVRIQVPAIMKLVVDPTALTPEGNPVVRLVTNVPALRALAAQGVAPEVLRQPVVQYAAEGRGKGGEAALPGNTEVEAGLVRYTIVQP